MLSENRRLWTILAVDVANSENRLPKELKANIFYLAEFTEAQSKKILKGDADIRPLVDINAAVMKGLRTQVEEK